jgi:hypothetical protein
MGVANIGRRPVTIREIYFYKQKAWYRRAERFPEPAFFYKGERRRPVSNWRKVRRSNFR